MVGEKIDELIQAELEHEMNKQTDRIDSLTKQLANELRKNDLQGATVCLDGESPVPETGYLVSIKQFERKASRVDDILPTVANMLQAYIFQPLFRRAPECYFLGVWLHRGQWFIDINTHIESLHHAAKFAQVESQLAIWDCENNCEIETDTIVDEEGNLR